MSSLNFIGGEKGGVGKSVVSRLLAQYFIDKEQPFVGFDTDRSHTSFTRFYADYASPVVVDSYEGLDAIAGAFEDADPAGVTPRVIVDLAAQTAAPLARWIKDSDVFAVLADMGIAVNFWHVADAGKDSVDLLGRLVNTFENGPNYCMRPACARLTGKTSASGPPFTASLKMTRSACWSASASNPG